jgi:hypothetical protein
MNDLSPFDMVVLVTFAIAAAKIFTGPLGAAIGDRIRGRRDAVPDARLSDEVERLQARLAEVEERVDFAERLLASREQADLGALRQESGR